MVECKISDFKPKKTAARMKIIDEIVDNLTSGNILINITRGNWEEKDFAIRLDNLLRGSIKKIFQELYPNQEAKKIAEKVDNALLWEKASNKTISTTPLFGNRHRPDFAIHIRGLKIAIELKRGEGGNSIQNGIGQSIIYSMDYDFVIYLHIDVSKDKKLINSSTKERESYLINSIWERYNVKFVII